MTEPHIIDQAVAALQANGIDAAVVKRDVLRRGHKIDAILRLRIGGLTYEYVAEAKRHVTPATLGGVLAQRDQFAKGEARPRLLVTEYMTPPLALRMKELDEQFIDTAGNAYLKGRGMLLWVAGRPRNPEVRQAPNRGAFTAAGLKVMFALICDLELANAPHRAIAEAANVALGVIPPVMADLRKQGHLAVAKRNRRLIGTKRLLDEWATAYARTLRPKMLLRTLATEDFKTWGDWDLEKAHAQWGGEPAARLFVKNLEPGVLTMYVKDLPTRLIVTHRMQTLRNAGYPPGYDDDTENGGIDADVRTFGINFRRAGTQPAGPVEIRKQFWGATLNADVPRITVPLPLIYADLLATGEARCMETARLIYDEHLARRFPTK